MSVESKSGKCFSKSFSSIQNNKCFFIANRYSNAKKSTHEQFLVHCYISELVESEICLELKESCRQQIKWDRVGQIYLACH